MPEYVVRLWVDLKVKAETKDGAKELAKIHPLSVPTTKDAELYDIQVSGQVWDR